MLEHHLLIGKSDDTLSDLSLNRMVCILELQLLLSDLLCGGKQMRDNFGHSEMLCACYTYQFNDYSRYAVTVFDEADKRRYRDEHFPTDLQNAFELGKRLVEEAK